MADDDLVIVFESMSSTEAELCRQRLEEAGIGVLDTQPNYNVRASLMTLNGRLCTLRVYEHNAARARKVVADFRREGGNTNPSKGQQPTGKERMSIGHWILLTLIILFIARYFWTLAQMILSVPH